jgi:diguanylate cyclase (GGDEF)-like protein
MHTPLLNPATAMILVVDDLPDNLRVLSAALNARGHQVRCAKNGAMALRAAGNAPPDLILLDIKMPDMDGYQVCTQLKANPQTCDIPVIFVSAQDDVLDKVKAFAVGGVDYITKPFQIEEVLARVQNQLVLQAAKAEIKTLNAELELRVQQRTAELAAANRILEQEIAERNRIEEQLVHDALHDSLTGLPNRSLFMERVAQALKHHQRQSNYLFAVLFVDLDRFKIINDSLGHAAGDQLLVKVAHLLESCLRATDTVARLGGDEFTILLDNIEGIAGAIHIAERLLETLMSPVELGDHTVFTNASIGIAFSSTGYTEASELLRDADIAMYRAKESGKARYTIFDQKMYAQALRLSQIESNLRLALERQEFILHYQPIFSLATSQLTGFEALIRWQHPEQGLISPAEFIPVAEDTGLILPMGEWVLDQACRQLHIWQSQYPVAADLRMSVNLTSQQIRQSNLSAKLANILTDAQVDGACLTLEMTESMLIDPGEATIRRLSQIRSLGIHLSIDDFGTGYSSLSYLHRFPINLLKIDRSFVGHMELAENFEIVKTILTLARTLGMSVVAEGVETAQQVAQLKSLACEFAQGFFFSKPLDSQAASQLLAAASQDLIGRVAS